MSASSEVFPGPATRRLIPADRSSDAAIWLSLLLATVVKVIWAMNSIGSLDARLFHEFGTALATRSLGEMYASGVMFNHTPLTAWFVRSLAAISGDSLPLFAALLRLPCIAADVIVVAVLMRHRALLGELPRWVLVLFALSPVSLMVSGFHANVDPILVMFLFLAGIACLRGNPWLCGLFFALACNVKVVPVMLGPVFFFWWLARGHGWRFATAAAVTALIGFAPALLDSPALFLKNVLGYNSIWGVWGVPYLLRLTGWGPVNSVDYSNFTAVQSGVAWVLKLCVLGGIAFMAWQRRKGSAEEMFRTLGIAWLLFFSCAIGIGVQYMVWCAPFILLLSRRYYALLTAALTIFLAVFYQVSSENGTFPWYFSNPMHPMLPYWTPWGLLPWAIFVAGLDHFRREFTGLGTGGPGFHLPLTQSSSRLPPQVGKRVPALRRDPGNNHTYGAHLARRGRASTVNP